MDQIDQVKLPVLTFGDFNSTLRNAPQYEKTQKGQNAMEYLLNDGQFIPYVNPDVHPANYTFPSEQPDRIVDWIAGRNIKGFVNSKTIASDLSDHFMITTEVVLDPTSQVKYLTRLP